MKDKLELEGAHRQWTGDVHVAASSTVAVLPGNRVCNLFIRAGNGAKQDARVWTVNIEVAAGDI